MFAVRVIAKSPGRVVRGVAALFFAEVRFQIQVLAANMTLEGRLLLERSLAGWELGAPELIVSTGMNGLVALKTCARTESFTAMRTGIGTVIFVCAFYVLLEVLLFHIRLIAAFDVTDEGSLASVGALVGGQSRGPVERFSASRVIATIFFVVAPDTRWRSGS